MAPVLTYILVRPLPFLRKFPSRTLEFWNEPIPNKTGTFRFFQSQRKGDVSGIGRVKKVSLVPAETVAASEQINFRSLLKPFLFTVSVCGCSYVGATIWQYENVRKLALQHHNPGSHVYPKYKHRHFRQELNRLWNRLTEGQRVALGIVAANSIIFLLWRIPAMQSTMLKYFSANPASKTVCLPMLLSTFSHYSFFHLTANMFVLYSFSTVAVSFFGKEQFLGFYISSGVVSSFVSYIHKVITRSPGFSLGASGSLMAVLASICFQFPQAQLSIVFLPFLTFKAGTAIKCVMGLDAVGLALGRKLFDHAGHLGGSLFGIAYLWYGQHLIWNKREPLLLWWHTLRQQRSDR